jgi:two-component system, OmpR family, response regulator QseB
VRAHFYPFSCSLLCKNKPLGNLKIAGGTIAGMHILLIEDDLDLGRALQASLKVEGLTSEWFRRSADVPQGVDLLIFDCALLDLTLPDGNGLNLLKLWRSQGVLMPVLIITAHGDVTDRLAGLDNGADDFIVKPFSTAELVSRIRAVLRRSSRQASEIWKFGPLTLEPKRRKLTLNGQDIDLSPREFHLLLELARDPGSVVAKGLLSQRLDPLGEPVDFAAIEVHVSNLRRKIGADRIKTMRGVGYLLQP